MKRDKIESLLLIVLGLWGMWQAPYQTREGWGIFMLCGGLLITLDALKNLIFEE